MDNKEVLKILSKLSNPSVREMVVNGFKESSDEHKKEVAKRLSSFKVNIKNDLDFRAKAIAAYVRYNMENFHTKHLSDEQMKELNPIIRNSIYTFLKDEENNDFLGMSIITALNLAPYWEDCERINMHGATDEFDEKEEVAESYS